MYLASRWDHEQETIEAIYLKADEITRERMETFAELIAVAVRKQIFGK